MRGMVLAAVMLASPAWAQELKSIEDTMEGIDDFLHVSAYSSARCAGLFDGIVAYGGQNMPATLVRDYQEASTTLVAGTTIMRIYQTRDRGLPERDFQTEFRNSDEEASRFRDIYRDRLQSNYTLTGSMIENDQVAKDDLALCGQVVESVRGIVEKEMELPTQ